LKNNHGVKRKNRNISLRDKELEQSLNNQICLKNNRLAMQAKVDCNEMGEMTQKFEWDLIKLPGSFALQCNPGLVAKKFRAFLKIVRH
jgi:hypothetical protein